MPGLNKNSLNNCRVKIICDSHIDDKRATTFKARMPRYLLPELSTHDLLSKSTESSRAVPIKQKIAQLKYRYWMPEFRQHKAGMQAGDVLSTQQSGEVENMYIALKDYIASKCEIMDRDYKVHKQYVNRLLEPFSFVDVILTATDFDNYFALRAHPDADPGFEFIAKAMYIAYTRSIPLEVCHSDYPTAVWGWHLPFITERDIEVAAKCIEEKYKNIELPVTFLGTDIQWHLCRWSAVRCARTSYKLFDGKEPDPNSEDRTWANLMGYDRDNPDEVLMAACGQLKKPNDSFPYDPIHASPAKHQACSMKYLSETKSRLIYEYDPNLDTSTMFKSNLLGVCQFRKMLPHESVKVFDVPSNIYSQWVEEIPEIVFDGDW